MDRLRGDIACVRAVDRGAKSLQQGRRQPVSLHHLSADPGTPFTH
jgi:hypothetical protein